MKEPIENSIKNVLENFEMPYQQGAWEQMSKRLDKTTLAEPVEAPFYKKWWFAASIGAILVSSATYFGIKANEPTNLAENGVSKETESTSASTVTDGIASTKSHTENKLDNSSTVTNPQLLTTYISENNKPINQGTTFDFTETIAHQPESNTTHSTSINKIDNYAATPTIVINSNNEKPTSVAIDCETVKNNRLFIDVDASLLYENGIPTLKFEAQGSDNPITWETAIASKSIEDNSIVVHPFNARNVTVIAKTIDENGCAISETKTVSFKDNYNLLAMDAFRPQGSIESNKIFMPFALTQREGTQFELMVIDPSNGGTVFRTNDATRGWDGTDMRTNQPVQSQTVWPWRVMLKNPLPGEPREYSGTITRL